MPQVVGRGINFCSEVSHDIDAALTSSAALEESAGNPETRLLSIVVPTFNERDNVSELVRRLEGVLWGVKWEVKWEVVFVDDDSTDDTPQVLRALAQSNTHVRHLHRIGRRGLASAVVEGILSTSSPYVAVMDADLQHDEGRLPDMLDKLRTTDCDIVMALATSKMVA